MITEAGFDSIRPRSIEGDAVDASNHVDANGLYSDLKDETRSREIVDGQVVERGPEGRQCGDDALGIRVGWTNPNVQVLRRAHEAVCGQCVSADYEKLNAMRVEFG